MTATTTTAAEPALTRWLRRASVPAFTLFAMGTAFAAYFCMYAFRKPFAVAQFEDQTIGFLSLKSALVMSQVCGYALSKILGIKFVSEARPGQRAIGLLLLIGWAQLALLLFAVLPPGGKIVAIFLNGVPLGAVWGLVFSFLEGRRTSEILGAGLSCSYIVASGAVKSAGKWVLGLGVSEAWMPFVTGLVFLPPFVVMVYGLSRLPPPTEEDEALRTVRRPMDKDERRAFLREFALGLGALVVLYFFLTAYRDFRDNFAAELWKQLDPTSDSSVFTVTEIPIAFAVMATLALLYRVKDNRKALGAAHAIMFAGSALVGIATAAFDAGLLGPKLWMIAIGLGLYLAYVPFGSVLFDRLIAAMGTVATAVFMIYVTDAVGYVGSIGVLLYKEIFHHGGSILAFFRGFSYFTAIVCTACFLASHLYFARRTRSVLA